MKNIKIIAMIMALCMLATLIACTNEQPDGTPTGTSEEVTTTKKEEVTTAEKEEVTTAEKEEVTTADPNEGEGEGEGGGTTVEPKYPWATQGGDGTEASPLIINQTNFAAFYEYYIKGGWNGFLDVNEFFKLGSDIVVNEGDAATWETTAPAVVYNAPLAEFMGTFDGDGHSISGLYIKVTDGRAALFNQIEAGSVVKNVRIINSYFEVTTANVDNKWNYNSAGSIAGRLLGNIENCYSNAIIKCDLPNPIEIMVGGFVGMINKTDSKVVGCVFEGTIKCSEVIVVGGIAGKINANCPNVVIENCVNKGTVTGSPAGGIVGKNLSTDTVLKNCTNEGTVTGTVSGDLMGYGHDYKDGTETENKTQN